MIRIQEQKLYNLTYLLESNVLQDPTVLWDQEKTFVLKSHNNGTLIPGFVLEFLKQRETNPDYDTNIDPFIILDLMHNVNQDNLFTGLEVLVEEIEGQDFVPASELSILNTLYDEPVIVEKFIQDEYTTPEILKLLNVSIIVWEHMKKKCNIKRKKPGKKVKKTFGANPFVYERQELETKLEKHFGFKKEHFGERLFDRKTVNEIIGVTDNTVASYTKKGEAQAYNFKTKTIRIPESEIIKLKRSLFRFYGHFFASLGIKGKELGTCEQIFIRSVRQGLISLDKDNQLYQDEIEQIKELRCVGKEKYNFVELAELLKVTSESVAQQVRTWKIKTRNISLDPNGLEEVILKEDNPEIFKPGYKPTRKKHKQKRREKIYYIQDYPFEYIPIRFVKHKRLVPIRQVKKLKTIRIGALEVVDKQELLRYHKEGVVEKEFSKHDEARRELEYEFNKERLLERYNNLQDELENITDETLRFRVKRSTEPKLDVFRQLIDLTENGPDYILKRGDVNLSKVRRSDLTFIGRKLHPLIKDIEHMIRVEIDFNNAQVNYVMDKRIESKIKYELIGEHNSAYELYRKHIDLTPDHQLQHPISGEVVGFYNPSIEQELEEIKKQLDEEGILVDFEGNPFLYTLEKVKQMTKLEKQGILMLLGGQKDKELLEEGFCFVESIDHILGKTTKKQITKEDISQYILDKKLECIEVAKQCNDKEIRYNFADRYLGALEHIVQLEKDLDQKLDWREEKNFPTLRVKGINIRKYENIRRIAEELMIFIDRFIAYYKNHINYYNKRRAVHLLGNALVTKRYGSSKAFNFYFPQLFDMDKQVISPLTGKKVNFYKKTKVNRVIEKVQDLGVIKDKHGKDLLYTIKRICKEQGVKKSLLTQRLQELGEHEFNIQAGYCQAEIINKHKEQLKQEPEFLPEKLAIMYILEYLGEKLSQKATQYVGRKRTIILDFQLFRETHFKKLIKRTKIRQKQGSYNLNSLKNFIDERILAFEQQEMFTYDELSELSGLNKDTIKSAAYDNGTPRLNKQGQPYKKSDVITYISKSDIYQSLPLLFLSVPQPKKRK